MPDSKLFEDLETALDELREDVERIDELEELLETNLTGVFTRIGALDDRLDSVEIRLDDFEEEVKRASATASKNKQDKIQKGIDVLEFGATKKTHGMAGVAITTGEVLAAANGSRSRAQTLIDQIAASLHIGHDGVTGWTKRQATADQVPETEAGWTRRRAHRGVGMKPVADPRSTRSGRNLPSWHTDRALSTVSALVRADDRPPP